MTFLKQDSIRSACLRFSGVTLLILASSLPLAAPLAQAAPAPTLNGLESSVTIYTYPPRHAIDWSSPGRALGSFVGNLLRIALSNNSKVEFTSDFNESGTMSSRFKSSMGHAIGHIRCTLPNGEIYDRWSSLSGQDLASVDKSLLFEKKIGLGALFYNYLDGHIISGEENKARIANYKGKKLDGERIRPRYMQFEVDAASCANMKDMVQFFESFHYPHGTTLAQLQRRPKEKILYFTNMMDPYETYLQRKRTGKGLVGGGCAPYGVALLKVAGRYHPALDSFWKTNLSISERLIGGLRDQETGEIREVSLRRLLFTSLGRYWDHSEDGYRNRPLSIYDPQKFWAFTGNVLGCVTDGPGCGPKTKALVASEKGLIRRGQPRIFRGYKQVEQRVEGIVWRMR